ncbi:MAG: hypothetical protein ACI95X_001291 [Paraglaciecola sp.]
MVGHVFVLHIKGESRDEAFDDRTLEVRQSHSSEEATEQAGLTLRAEDVEGRGLTERKYFQRRIAVTQSIENLASGLERLGKVAKQDKALKFNNLMRHITPVLLLDAFQ